MDSRERILAVFNHQIPDKVPCLETAVDNLPIAKHYHARLPLGFSANKFLWVEKLPGWRRIPRFLYGSQFGYKFFANALVDYITALRYDAVVLPVSIFMKHNWDKKEFWPELMPHFNEFVDEYGRENKIIPTKYGFDIAFYMKGHLDSEAAYDHWGLFDPHDPVRMVAYESAKQRAAKKPIESRPFVIPGIGGICEMTWESLGMTFFAKCLRRKRAFLERVIEDRKLLAAEMIKDMAAHGAEIMVQFDDLGFKEGPLMNPTDFRELFAPRLKYLVDLAHSLKMKFWLHSCGNLNSLLPDLVATGIDALHPIEPTARMDIFQLKKQYPQLVLIGNVSPQDLQDKSPDFIRAYVTRLMTEIKPEGHYIMCSGHSINPAVTLDNYLVMRETHQKLAKY